MDQIDGFCVVLMNCMLLEIDFFYMKLGGGYINILVFIGDVVIVVVFKLQIFVWYLFNEIVKNCCKFYVL